MREQSIDAKIMKSHLGIYAVVEKDQSILLVKKSRGPYKGMWDLPGGRPSHGETIFQTLQREVMEETGIQLSEAIPHSNQAFVVEYNEGKNLISFHHTCLIYKAVRFDISQYRETINEEDVSGCAWIEKSQLSHLPLSSVVLCVT